MIAVTWILLFLRTYADMGILYVISSVNCRYEVVYLIIMRIVAGGYENSVKLQICLINHH